MEQTSPVPTADLAAFTEGIALAGAERYLFIGSADVLTIFKVGKLWP
jgi:hypothetical protein